jgi:hypothetical protein
MADYGVLQLSNKVDESCVTFASGDTPCRVGGLRALVQEALIELLSDPIPSRARGSGLRSLILTSDPSRQDTAVGTFRQAISSAKTHILSNQQKSLTLQPAERLRSLILNDAQFVNFSWMLDIGVTNQAGETASFTLP